MILIKDRHIFIPSILFGKESIGKYDTYKGSTLQRIYDNCYNGLLGGNMILIKDRHTTAIALLSSGSNVGNYDTYKESRPIC